MRTPISNVRSLELDIGWSSCDSEVIMIMLRHSAVFSRFKHIALYLNGIQLKQKNIEDLADLLTKSCIHLEGLALQLYDTGLDQKILAELKSVLSMKVNRPNI